MRVGLNLPAAGTGIGVTSLPDAQLASRWASGPADSRRLA